MREYRLYGNFNVKQFSRICMYFENKLIVGIEENEYCFLLCCNIFSKPNQRRLGNFKQRHRNIKFYTYALPFEEMRLSKCTQIEKLDVYTMISLQMGLLR